MFCGARSLKSNDEPEQYHPPPPRPAASKASKKKAAATKNPCYSRRGGLDRLSRLVSELKSRRGKAMVKPCSRVVAMEHEVAYSSEENTAASTPAVLMQPKWEVVKRANKNTNAAKLGATPRPSCSWLLPMGVVVVLILGCLMAAGKAIAICCTCLWLYVLPLSPSQRTHERLMRNISKNSIE